MIREALQWVGMPASRSARRLGLVSDVIALEARHRRQRSAWAPHLQACRTRMIRAAEHVAPLEQGKAPLCVVLGSGWLFDLPVRILSDRFDRIVLVDVVVPRAVRRLCRRQPEFGWREADLTGMLDWLIQDPTTIPKPPRGLPPDISALCHQASLVISANLLSQLPLAPHRYLAGKGFDDAVVQLLCREIVAAHVEALTLPGVPVLLITDTDRQDRDPERRRPTEQTDLLYGVRPRVQSLSPDLSLGWVWDVAPPPEEGPGHHIQHRVKAGWLSHVD